MPIKVKDRKTGQTYSIEWNEDRDPTDYEVDRLIHKAKFGAPKKKASTGGGILGKVSGAVKWADDTFNTSLGVVTPFTNRMADFIQTPVETKRFLSDVPILGDIEEGVIKAGDAARNFSGGAVRLAGEIMDPSVLDIATFGTAKGATMASKMASKTYAATAPKLAKRAFETAKTMKGLEAAANIGLAAQGVGNVAVGAAEGDWGRAARGGVQAFAGRSGAKQSVQQLNDFTPPTTKFNKARPFEKFSDKELSDAMDMKIPGAIDEYNIRSGQTPEPTPDVIENPVWESVQSTISPGSKRTKTVPTDPYKDIRDASPNLMSLFGGKKSKSLQVFQPLYENWVGERAAAKMHGLVRAEEFKDLDAQGMAGIIGFQNLGTAMGPEYQKVKGFFDNWYQALKGAGIKSGYRQNYVPQMWDNTPEEIAKVFGNRKLGLKPSFTMERVLEDYQEGISKGLKPKFEKMSDLVRSYEETSRKILADRKLYGAMKVLKLVRREGRRPGWEIVDPNVFPKMWRKDKKTGQLLSSNSMTPKDVRQVIENYLKRPEDVLTQAANAVQVTKNLALSAGIPKTAINAHGVNLWARGVFADLGLGGKNNIKDIGTLTRWVVQPSKAQDFLKANLKDLPFAAESGLVIGTEGIELGQKALKTGSDSWLGKGIDKVSAVHKKLFEDPLFQQLGPALKLKHFKKQFEINKALGMADKQAARASAEFTNELFGGLNYDMMARQKNFQNGLRVLLLAPDWFESNVQLAAGMGKAVGNRVAGKKNPTSKSYEHYAQGVAAAYVAANMMNYVSTAAGTGQGKFMWENDPGHAFDVYAGETANGKKRWIRPFGTAADSVRIPVEIGASAAQQDLGALSGVLKNRMSLPARATTNLLTNSDSFGRRIFGEDVYGNKIPVEEQVLGAGREVAGAFAPQYTRGFFDYGMGKAGAEEAFVGSFELPFRYQTQDRPRGRRKRSGIGSRVSSGMGSSSSSRVK